ncbi:hypothetical protein EV122DRAFT_288226 [Schizophyllum commune]
MKVLHVCSRWRSIALNAPLLWTNMSLLLRQVSSPEHIPHIIEWFRRAQPLAVDVHVQSRWHPEFRCEPRTEDSIVRGLLAPSGYSVSPTSQIRELDVFADPRDFVNITHGLPDDAFAQLRRLDIQCDYHNIVVGQLVNQPITAFKDCPQLSHVSLTGLWCLTREPLSFLLPLPWSQLTFLQLRRCDHTHQVLDVMIQCTNLQHAELDGTIHHRGAEWSDVVRVIDHRSLASLEVATDIDEWPAELFRIFRYPMLHELTLAFQAWGYAWGRGTDWDLVCRAVPRFPALSKFTLRNVNTCFAEADIMRFLVALPPTLLFIRFDRCLLQTEFFAHFRVDNDNACLPSLKTLIFSNVDLKESSTADGAQLEEELCRMVESRVCSDKVERLRTFEVTFSPSEKWVLSPSACERLRSLEGLEDSSAPIHSLPPELMVNIFRYRTLEAISSAMSITHGPLDDSGDVRPASQVRKLFFNGYPADVVSVFNGLPEDAFPRLQSLTITESCSYEVDERLAEQTISAFRRCPLLADVTILMMHRLTMDSLSSWLPLPWSQITTLRLEGCLDSHRIVDVLLQCKNLWLAVIQGNISGSEGLPVAPDDTDLPCLEYLEVRFDELQWPTHLFRVLRYPVVERLTLHFGSNHYLWAWSIQREDLLLAAPQFPALWKLTLRSADIRSDEEDLMAFLAALPRTMRFLRFIECLIWPDLFERLRVDDGVAPALPNLTELVFIDIEVREADPGTGEVDTEEELCRMVQSRVHSDKVECLRAFEFSYRAEQRLAPDTSRKLRSLEGLEVRLPKDAE